MVKQRTGSAKKIFYYHNPLILHKSKKQTVQNQLYVSLLERRMSASIAVER